MSQEKERRSREAMRRRAVDSLSYRLMMHRHRAPERVGLLQQDLDELPLFVELGALSDEEAKAWRERFTSVAEAFRAPDSEVVGEDQRVRARELLEEALEDYRTSEPGLDRLAFWRFPAVLRVLKAVGAISEDEASKWDRDFHEVLTEKSRPKREARQKAVEQARRGSSPASKAFAATELSRVVLGPPERLNGVRVTCAELYEDCVIVRWHRLLSADEIRRGEKACGKQPSPDELAAHFGAVLSLEDDLETDYASAERGNLITGDKAVPENDEVPVWGRSVFLPAVPRRVRHLIAGNRQDQFALEVA